LFFLENLPFSSIWQNGLMGHSNNTGHSGGGGVANFHLMHFAFLKHINSNLCTTVTLGAQNCGRY